LTDINISDIEVLMDLLVKCLDTFDHPPSVLFRKIDCNRLSIEHLRRLERDDRFDWFCLGDNRKKLIGNLASSCLRQARAIDRLIAANDKLVSEIARAGGEEFTSERSVFEKRLSDEREKYEAEIVKLKTAVDDAKSDFSSVVANLKSDVVHASVCECERLLKTNGNALNEALGESIKTTWNPWGFHKTVRMQSSCFRFQACFHPALFIFDLEHICRRTSFRPP
jgi:hypothetical protein